MTKRRLKWEPAALMVIVLGLGLWIAFGPASKPHFDQRPNALTLDTRFGNTRGMLEAAPDGPGGAFTFRYLTRDEPSPPVLSEAEAVRAYGARNVHDCITPRTNRLFRWLNITSWVGVVWLGIGMLGQVAFSGRMVLQWITSERKRQSVITESFWWFSLFGSLLLFSYFVWRQDPVAMLGQASGIVIYARNLRLIYKHKRRAARDASAQSDAGSAAGAGAQPVSEPSPDPSVAVRTLRPTSARRSATTTAP